jgi:hypothetical protein
MQFVERSVDACVGAPFRRSANQGIVQARAASPLRPGWVRLSSSASASSGFGLKR